MASRSTRNKIKGQAGNIKEHINKMFLHLQKIDELSGGSSEFINAQLSVLTDALNEYDKGFDRFSAEL